MTFGSACTPLRDAEEGARTCQRSTLYGVLVAVADGGLHGCYNEAAILKLQCLKCPFGMETN